MTVYLILGAIIVVMGFILYITISRISSLKTSMLAQKAAIENYETQLMDYAALAEDKKDVDIQNKNIKEKLNDIDIDKYADRVQDAPKRRTR